MYIHPYSHKGAFLLVETLCCLLKDNESPSKGHSIYFEAGALQYQLPAPLGRWIFAPTGTSQHFIQGQQVDDDFPYACSPGVVGDGLEVSSQNSPICSRPCPGESTRAPRALVSARAPRALVPTRLHRTDAV